VNEPTTPQAAPSAAAVARLATPDDQRLLAACLAGDPAGWDEFVRRFGGLFVHVAERTAVQRRTPLARADRDDLVAEILLACVRNDAAVLRGFAGRASLPTYLTVIARRVVARALVRRLESGRLVSPSAAVETAVTPRSDLARAVDREHVESLLQRLDTDEAKLVRLHHLEGRSYGEISRLTGLPLGSIGPALSRAKAKMRA
jgi:RNA polymerase sigma-70 factor (ECF subfamily)